MKRLALIALLISCGGGAVAELSEPRVINYPEPNPHILITARVNGLTGIFILDTGTKTTWLNRPFAELAGVTEDKQYTTTSWFYNNNPGTSAIVGEGIAESVEVFGKTFSGMDVRVMNTQIYSEGGVTPDGLMGLDVMQGSEIAIVVDKNHLIVK